MIPIGSQAETFWRKCGHLRNVTDRQAGASYPLKRQWTLSPSSQIAAGLRWAYTSKFTHLVRNDVKTQTSCCPGTRPCTRAVPISLTILRHLGSDSGHEHMHCSSYLCLRLKSRISRYQNCVNFLLTKVPMMLAMGETWNSFTYLLSCKSWYRSKPFHCMAEVLTIKEGKVSPPDLGIDEWTCRPSCTFSSQTAFYHPPGRLSGSLVVMPKVHILRNAMFSGHIYFTDAFHCRL